ncbi:MAG: glutaredoxin 3 [Zetaproteobacteria bacterium CG06_land_8_20_14_3_00_59_53]|nr:MAG: glutaredoxin 3 [Zetaproteobacteria bacterium CG2_30_59_37]PIO89679.1 MAG: glutaredoxin 3 [Zetaproteobacteria bacterium CG23_combo_of_CG06-09_8_20_14_all_59_86]PIQ65748.1 MAG: glutaredoxin 3 [Zetaproteobacteria bacterium CG11_big_fil_rev_8_21_14_0_20_59_439]PIU70089.1 MAG: glutaredoxin 3 [Zetaproteobacteria bacterium CG06_land_8_20_14_3_00_59_53]PIU96570.1 MAG: glutaredoxin 3 [Zetaproteobacteria bacterium CG03_land_8_20_14_0_80_59_51]PIY46100.1 MAG: glutaredoxin 3 [Zetaproteobacteria ba
MPKIEIYSSSWCPYCVRAKALLQKKGLEFTEYNIETDPARREEMLERSEGARTVPQIFINDRHVLGGCDGLYALEKRNELDNWLK